VDISKVNVQDRIDLTIQSLLNGDVDVIDAWMITEVAELLAAGHEINMIIPSDYGIDVYPQVIFTTEDMIKNNPELVQRFLDATLLGMQAAMANPNDAVDIILTYNSQRTREVELSAMYQLLPLMLPAGSYPGEMTADIWVYTQDLLISQELLNAPLDDLNAAYTTQFLHPSAR
jgi:NitT/TauT family transport system substrate-binding protein